MDQGWTLLGQRVREARQRFGLSTRDLGVRLGIDEQMVERIEAGEQPINSLMLGQAEDVFGLPMEYFVAARLSPEAREFVDAVFAGGPPPDPELFDIMAWIHKVAWEWITIETLISPHPPRA